jgi:outer membrane lipoprotein carrier protein
MMQSFKRLAFVAIGFFGLCLPAQANEPASPLSADEARSIVREFVESTGSYHANFAQVLQSAAGEVLEEEAGELWLQRPGQFRWQYTTPWERQIVANRAEIWLYDAELDQVTLRSAEGALLESPAALLVGDASALDDYNFSGILAADGTTLVNLEPLTSHGDFQLIGLRFSQGKLLSLELHDRYGQLTVIRFSDIVINPVLNQALFQFELPAGADVIDQRID